MTAYLASGTRFKGNRLNSPSTPVARANAEQTASALLRISGVDSRYGNARFQILGRSICVVAEYECVSRSIPCGKGRVGEDAPREAWPRALSQYGAR